MRRWRRPIDSITDFVDSIETIIGIVTQVRVSGPQRYDPSPMGVRALELGTGQPVALRGPGRISLQVRLRYRLDHDDEGWGAQIVAYQYALLDQREQETDRAGS